MSVQKYAKRDIQLGDILGQGSFGVVQKGDMNGTQVAVKVLKVSMKQDAEIELNVMAQLSHRNVLKLIGVVKEDFATNPRLIFEFMENGSLSDFVSRGTVSNDAVMSLCYDIACGMDYLHDMQHIHRDLAGRNVLVDSQRRAKVADFGLSRFINEEAGSYYKINQDKPLPYRWAPKESIPTPDNNFSGRFSYSSDVWSFGVTMWEAWTRGGLPYRSISKTSNQTVVEEILRGKNPNDFERPPAPRAVLEIMDLIFKDNYKERPTFAQLKVKLRHIKERSVTTKAQPQLKTLENVQHALAELKVLSKGNLQLIKSLKDAGKIKTTAVEVAMQNIDRGNYTESNPYSDKPSSIGCNVNISAPHMHAVMLEYAAEKLRPGNRVLDIGSGSGYVTACLAWMVERAGRVIGIDHMPELVEKSLKNIKKDQPNFISEQRVKLVVGDGRKGYADGAPYDLVHIGAATPGISQTLAGQLREGGRIVAPVGPPGGPQSLQVIDKIDGRLIAKTLMGVIFAPLTTQAEQLGKK